VLRERGAVKYIGDAKILHIHTLSLHYVCFHVLPHELRYKLILVLVSYTNIAFDIIKV